MSLKKGSEVELLIESAAFKGKGVAKHNGIAVFVPGTAPGDKVRAMIVKRKKKYREARLLEILEPSPDRIKPRCSHASVCGGCTWQHLPYSAQLKIKEEQVRDHIKRIAHLDPAIVQPIIGCEDEFYYRNKMEYSFGTRKWLSREEIEKDEYIDDSGLCAGLHAPGRFDKILDLNECHLQIPVSYQILDTLRNYCLQNNIQAFDTINNTGYMRHLMIRNSHHSGELMVNLVTYRDEPELVEKISKYLVTEFPEITTVVNNVNDQPNPTAVGRIEHILFGPGTITDSIGGYTFKIDPNAFFQTNTKQAEALYSVARDFADLNTTELLYDLYCGVGTLTLFMSSYARKVVGIELVDVAVENARENAKTNGVLNTEFILGDMKQTFKPDLHSKYGHPDCILTDPPRSGMHPDVVRELINLKVPRMVYVSCNPSTMARDLKELNEIYEIEKVQPVDMFPQTYHIEAVAKLTLR
jgi:23S rRNA (uracil1939-C5)-methyltransferase